MGSSRSLFKSPSLAIVAFTCILLHQTGLGSASDDGEGLKPAIKILVDNHRRQIQEALRGFPMPGNKSIEEFTPETNGRPIQNVIIASWKTGSSYIGELLNTIPATYNHYEPLFDFGILQIRDEPFASIAVRNLKKLLKCDYQDLDHYLNFTRYNAFQFIRNKWLADLVKSEPDHYFDPQLLEPICKLLPWHAMKVTRLRLALAGRLLGSEDLNVRIVLLVRDPRAIIVSRKKWDWCNLPDCNDPARLCADMVSDYEAAKELSVQYPKRLKVVRFEEYVTNPMKKTEEIMNFYGLPFHESLKKMIAGRSFLPIIDTVPIAFTWKKKIQFDDMLKIQGSCEEAMSLWGYKPIMNTSALSDPDFSPLLPLHI